MHCREIRTEMVPDGMHFLGISGESRYLSLFLFSGHLYRKLSTSTYGVLKS